MPTTIEIPKRHREGLTIVNSLPEDVFQRLVAALETVIDPNSVDETVPNADLPDVSIYEVETVVHTVLSIYRVRAFRGQAVEPFVKDLSAAMETPVGDKYIAPEQREKFSSRLEKLLSIDRLLTFSKALSLQYEKGFVIFGARILTDLRPVFRDDADAGASGFLLMHTLKISYNEQGDHRELYFSLDESDLKQIKDALQRAETKAAQLRQLMRSKSIPDLTP